METAAAYLTGPRCPEHTPAAIAGRPEPGRTAGHTPSDRYVVRDGPRHFPDDEALECVHCRRPVAAVNVALFGAAEHVACTPPPRRIRAAWAEHERAKREAAA